jgi:hypothetical protein
MTDPFKSIKSYEECKQYCIENLDWRDLPKEVVSELFKIAWDHGHSHGYYAVFSYASDLQPLVDSFRKHIQKILNNENFY